MKFKLERIHLIISALLGSMALYLFVQMFFNSVSIYTKSYGLQKVNL